jgi:4-carboxymuconolactone decarboxylase
MEIPRPTTPRIPPLADDAMTSEQDGLVAPTRNGSAATATNLFNTLVRHPGLFRKWAPAAGKLLDGAKLPPRDRELLILRTGWRCRAQYEWGQHVAIGHAVGLGEEDLTAVAAGPDTPGLDTWDAVLLRAADELHDDACLSDATWASLAERYDDRQLIEVPMLVGAYHQISFLLNSLGVPLDDGVTGFPEPGPSA